MNKNPIGILSGTFDPIHLGHTHLASTIHKQCDLQKILIIPCHQSPFKKLSSTSAKDRIKMIKLAIKDLPYLKLEDYEIKRPEISYMINTIEYLSKQNPASPLVLIMGIDLFNRFDEWREWRKILDLSHILVVSRQDHEEIINKNIIELLSKRQIYDPKQLQKNRSGLIYVTNIDPLPIIATEIRALLGQQKNAGHLLNPDVSQYINDNKLYRSLLEARGDDDVSRG